ncbi:wdr83 [Symbiodinium microadriaticum]|nr:wdr83 [Symbiodinium microadriaticum]
MAPAEDLQLPGPEPVQTLTGHESGVLALTWTQNGQYIMTASQDKSVRLWNPHSGKHIKKFAGCHNQEVNDIRIAADNSKFVSCGSDKLIFLWDVTSAQVIRKLTGHDRKVNALAFGPKEDVLLSASHDKTVKIWDMRTRSRAPIQTLSDAVDSILCLITHKDAIISGSVDGGLRHYDLRKGQLVTDQLLQPISSISVSEDGQCLLVSTLDSNIRLLEREDGSELATYSGHSNRRVKVRSSLDPSDSFVASGSEDGTLHFWELVEATPLRRTKSHEAALLCLAFHEDTLVTAAADGVIKVWRQRLQNTAAFDSKHFQSNPEFVIADLDVSQNKLTLDQFQSLFLLLGTAGVRVLRFRMFGCATLTDEALKVISDLVTISAAWALTGLRAKCIYQIETNLFPRPVAPSATTGYPLYLRMENNYIDEAVIREKASSLQQEGARKQVGGARTGPIQGPKVNFLVKVLNSTYGQRTGPPPAPENAPPPKQAGLLGSIANARLIQAMAGVEPPSRMDVAEGQRQGMGRTKPCADASSSAQTAPRATMGQSSGPVSRTVAPPTAVKKAETVPHPWEVHHSTEYQLDYYWNSETGESVWEKPEKW